MVSPPSKGFQKGEVYAVKESVYAPYRRIFTEAATTGPTQWALSAGITSRIANHSASRPCAMWDDVEDPTRSQVYVYLMTTYESRDINQMPWIFRFFSFPVSPNLRTYDTNMDGAHFHTMPEWADHRPQWLIVIPVRTLRVGAKTELWPPSKTARAHGVGPYSFGRKTMTAIDGLYLARIEQWYKMCEEPGFLSSQADLLNKHEEEETKRKAEGTDYGSQVSVRTKRTAKYSSRTKKSFDPSIMMPILEDEKLDGPHSGPTAQRERAPLRTSTLTNAPGGTSRMSPYPRSVSSKQGSRTSLGSLDRNLASVEIRTPTEDVGSSKTPQRTRSRRGAGWKGAKAVMARAVPASLRKSSKDSN